MESIPKGYFKGHRRIVPSKEYIVEEKCWTCRHALGLRRWHCDISPECEYEPCYCKNEISEEDYKRGLKLYSEWRGTMWINTPDHEKIRRSLIKQLDYKRGTLDRDGRRSRRIEILNESIEYMNLIKCSHVCL